MSSRKMKIKSMFNSLLEGAMYLFYVPRTEFRKPREFPKTAEEALKQDMEAIRKDAVKVWGEDWDKWPKS